MRSGLFFLSVGLLAFGINLPGTFGQNVSDAAPGPLILTCMINVFYPVPSLRWYRNDEEVASSSDSASNSLPEGESPQEFLRYSKLDISGFDLRRDLFTCVVEPKGRRLLTVQKITDEDKGNPSASVKTIRKPCFHGGSEMSMSCIVEGERPPGISIVWQRNGSPLPQGTYEIHNSNENPYLMYSNLTLHKTCRYCIGKNYSCIIGHQGLEIQKTEEIIPVKDEAQIG